MLVTIMLLTVLPVSLLLVVMVSLWTFMDFTSVVIV